MNTKFVAGIAVLGLVLGGWALFLGLNPPKLNLTGVTVSNSGGLDQQALISELQLLANVTGSLSATTTSPYGPGTLNTSSTNEKNFTVSGAAVGDYVLVGLSTSTQNVYITARVSAANQVAVDITNESTTATTVATSTYNLTIVPFASFQAPSGL